MRLFILLLLLKITTAYVISTYEAEEKCEFCTSDDDVCEICPKESFDDFRNTSDAYVSDGDVIFYLYTKGNVRSTMKTNQLISATKFKSGSPTQIIVHGWQNSDSSPMPQKIKNAFLNLYSNSDVNVIVVDWSKHASNLLYPVSKKACYGVADLIWEFILGLNEQKVPVSAIHMLGHSLGGQIVGLVGRKLKLKPIEIDYFTIMDPAKPCWNSDSVNKGDAKYVEVIHTNTGCYGKERPSGHVDYYVNYGKSQLGCETSFDISCSHARAYEYVAESIWIKNQQPFIGTQCTNKYDTIKDKKCVESNPKKYGYMGGFFPKPKDLGLYYVETNKASPFATGQLPTPKP